MDRHGNPILVQDGKPDFGPLKRYAKSQPVAGKKWKVTLDPTTTVGCMVKKFTAAIPPPRWPTHTPSATVSHPPVQDIQQEKKHWWLQAQFGRGHVNGKRDVVGKRTHRTTKKTGFTRIIRTWV